MILFLSFKELFWDNLSDCNIHHIEIHFNPNKAGLFEFFFSWMGQFNNNTSQPFIFQEELIQYQYNFIQLLNTLFQVG